MGSVLGDVPGLLCVLGLYRESVFGSLSCADFVLRRCWHPQAAGFMVLSALWRELQRRGDITRKRLDQCNRTISTVRSRVEHVFAELAQPGHPHQVRGV